MSGRGRLTVHAAAAALLTACALLPLAAPASWLLEAALLVSVQSAVGWLARRARLPSLPAVLLQAGTTLGMLVFGFVRDQAPAGVLPGPAALRALGALAGQGLGDAGQYPAPAPLTPGIRLLLVGGVVVVALAVDALAVGYRAPAPAGLPLLALYSVASGLSRSGGHWLWFLPAAGGYLSLLLAEGRGRLAGWGRIFGSGPRSGTGAGLSAQAASGPLRTGRRMGAVVLGIALIAPVALPAVDGGLIAPAGGGGLGPGGGVITAVNPLVSLQDSLNQATDQELLRYRTTSDDVPDMYLRILTLDRFDGTSWQASQQQVGSVPDPLPAPAGLSPAVRTSQATTEITAAPGYAQTYLPMPYPASRVQAPGDWRFEPEGRTLVGDRGQTTAGLRYQVSSLDVQPTAQQLADAGPPPAALVQRYTQVPAGLPAEVRQTALLVTQGAADAYQEAVDLQDWFTTTGGFSYDTRVKEGSGIDAIVRFLHDRRGFCVHFAFTMAAMARTLGIPARVDVGFVPGTPLPDSTWSVGTKDAHAWPELYFQGVGWTRFEPTPSRGSTPAYTHTGSTAGQSQDGGVPQRGSTAAPAPQTTAGSSCPAARQHSGGCAPAGPGSAGALTGGGAGSAGAGLGLAAAGSLVLLGAVPMLWRRRVRAARLASGDPQAAWRELVDTAWDYGVPPDAAETPRRAAERIIRTGGLPPAAAESARRIGASVERFLYAAQPEREAAPEPAGERAGDVRLVRECLHARAGRWAALRAVWAPRSARQLLWRWQEAVAAAAAVRRSAVRRAAAAVRPPDRRA